MGREILPHEREVRSWLRRRVPSDVDVEDIVQECYCRIAQLTDVSHVTMPRAYFFSVARNLVHQTIKVARVVKIEAMSDLDDWESEEPSPERIAAARQEWGRVQAAIGQLSERARRIFIMRKIDGLAQKEIARALGVTETVVENDASRGLRSVLRALTEPEPEQIVTPPAEGLGHARSR
ncbi:RNA polymerase sigma factor [Sphingomonas sp. AP4-R1]|uniref:RNA polymerase sigma factor n=1 Tax=Sphingomonas sp. AP4-R1 TaxID=2735134 RepID=UPI0014938096|nr:RNA polymerase sigma factor [Sphingomonas sp. AP4-R1]QJU59095.1 RNA polymerase sigma factor [Sphingomonas sp. AP4-R1]